MTAPAALPDLGAYRRFVVALSGGKDSLAALLHLLSLGVPAHAIELHHHDVDGHGPTFMDWPCTPSYVRAIADHFGIALYVSWREGGFGRELARDDAPTAPIAFETPTGIGRAGGNGPAGTRGLFPQTSPDLRVRWCSPALKIDVLAAAIRNQPRFLDGRTLVITGERAEESPSRARYATLEPHRTSMDETVGPNESECPAAILDELTATDSEYALAWRARCRANLLAKKLERAKPTPKPGQTIIFDEPMRFSDGSDRSRFEVVANPKGKTPLFRDPESRAICRIPAFRKRAYRIVHAAIVVRDAASG